MIEKLHIDTEKPLKIDIIMNDLVRVDDLYKDKTTFFKTLRKGEHTASPYRDC